MHTKRDNSYKREEPMQSSLTHIFVGPMNASKPVNVAVDVADARDATVT